MVLSNPLHPSGAPTAQLLWVAAQNAPQFQGGKLQSLRGVTLNFVSGWERFRASLLYPGDSERVASLSPGSSSQALLPGSPTWHTEHLRNGGTNPGPHWTENFQGGNGLPGSMWIKTEQGNRRLWITLSLKCFPKKSKFQSVGSTIKKLEALSHVVKKARVLLSDAHGRRAGNLREKRKPVPENRGPDMKQTKRWRDAELWMLRKEREVFDLNIWNTPFFGLSLFYLFYGKMQTYAEVKRRATCTPCAHHPALTVIKISASTIKSIFKFPQMPLSFFLLYNWLVWVRTQTRSTGWVSCSVSDIPPRQQHPIKDLKWHFLLGQSSHHLQSAGTVLFLCLSQTLCLNHCHLLK